MKAIENRANTLVPDRILSPDMILCAGEDSRDLLHSLREALPGETPRRHHFRCYTFWKYRDVTAVLTGIGTGCLEPLVWELAESGIVRRIVMIGTAGFIGTSHAHHGKVFVIDKAYLAGAGVSVKDPTKPILPQFAGLEKLSLSRQSTISSDYYYGGARSRDPRVLMAQHSNPVLAEAMAKVHKEGRLVDMETAQFYRLCELYGGKKLEYVAFRGVANMQGQWDEQSQFAESVLTRAAQQAVHLLAA